jgi:hypothetical protein
MLAIVHNMPRSVFETRVPNLLWYMQHRKTLWSPRFCGVLIQQVYRHSTAKMGVRRALLWSGRRSDRLYTTSRETKLENITAVENPVKDSGFYFKLL